jgi:hypothetical protein
MASSTFSSGDRVVLHSLNTETLNGKKGTIDKFVKDEGRWAVKVDKVNGLKSILPKNLKFQDTVAAVVIPTEGAIYFKEYPARTLDERIEALKSDIDDPYGNTSNYYYYYRRNGESALGYMTFTAADTFRTQPINSNLTTLGWNSRPDNTIQGPVVIQFSDGGINETGDTMYWEPYDLDTVKTMVKELQQARTSGHPTRDKCARGDYRTLAATPGVLAKFSDE